MTEMHVRETLVAGSYLVAAAWCWKSFAAASHLPKLPQLLQQQWNVMLPDEPRIHVVVPARNEEANIAATLESLITQDYNNIQILAINDRSDDATGSIIDSYAAQSSNRLRAIHIHELPAGWLGKTHAMQAAVEESDSDYLLLTDADILFEPTIIRRALAYAESTGADHVVVAPTPDLHTLGEGAMLGFLQVLGLWASRPWKVADPKAKRDFLGVGAFNLVRRSAFERVGGWEAQKLAVVEDVVLGRRLKLAGAAQRFVVAPGAVRVHWAPGLTGTVRVMTKNLFAILCFQPVLVLTSCAFIVLFFFGPIAMLFWRATLLAGLLSLISIALCYRSMRTITGIRARNFMLFPLGAVAFIYAMFRSAYTVLRNDGVEWRGTHYSLAQLRPDNSFSVKR